MNLSMAFMASSVTLAGESANFSSVPVSSGNDFQMVHAVFFPCPTKDDTVSQPIIAWNIGRANDLSGPKQEDISWAAKYRKFFPVPNASQISY